MTLYLLTNPSNIEQRFRERTGISMSITEGSSTKKDKKLMQLRKDSFRGIEIEITPHINFHSGSNRYFRIYFGILNKEATSGRWGMLQPYGYCGNSAA